MTLRCVEDAVQCTLVNGMKVIFGYQCVGRNGGLWPT